MMGLGTLEILVLAGVALIVMCPEKFPEFAKIVVRTIRDLRGYVDEVKSDLAKEVRPVKDELRKLSSYRPEEYLDSLMEVDEEDHPTADVLQTGKDGGTAPASPYREGGPSPEEKVMGEEAADAPEDITPYDWESLEERRRHELPSEGYDAYPEGGDEESDEDYKD